MKEILKSKGNFKGFYAILLFMVIIGCVQYSLIRTDREIQVGSVFKVESPINWSKSEINGVETWTIDGLELQRLMFFKGIKDGKPLFKIRGEKEKNLPLYKSSMTPLEIRELIEATLVRSGGHDIETKDFRPERFGGLDGFQFDFRYMNENGLKYNGLVVGAQKDDRLLAIMYLGTALYHFGKHLDDVKKIISSVEIL